MELSQNLVFSQDSVLASGYWTMWLSSWDQGLEVLGFQGPGLATCRHWSALQRRSQPLHFPKKDQQQGLIVPGQGQEGQRGLISFRTLSITWHFDSLGASEICRHSPQKACSDFWWQCQDQYASPGNYGWCVWSPGPIEELGCGSLPQAAWVLNREEVPRELWWFFSRNCPEVLGIWCFHGW